MSRFPIKVEGRILIVLPNENYPAQPSPSMLTIDEAKALWTALGRILKEAKQETISERGAQ